MKVVLVSLNSKYIHMSLAPWYLKAACDQALTGHTVTVLEMTVNQQPEDILRKIYLEKPDVIGFSCYIFNITLVKVIASDCKKLLPHTLIVLGGPEVSYDPREMLLQNRSVDFIISGEGETPLPELIRAAATDGGWERIGGLAYRCGEDICVNSPSPAPQFDTIPSPYTDEMLQAAKGKILYYESSRGCPFHCSYCLSSVTGGVRFLSLERVKSELSRIMRSQVRQVKFVDRTFNGNISRAKEIVSFILESCAAYESERENGYPENFKNFHFEAAPDLFDDELISLLENAPDGLFQLEIGIQSFNERTLEACGRKTDLSRSSANIRRLLLKGNMHIHLDLIAGLPYEDYTSFGSSFDSVYALKPHCIQLGFLKLLKGSGMRARAPEQGMIYRSAPPYEILKSSELGYEELLLLKQVEFAVDRLYNSGKFRSCLDFLIHQYSSPFQLFLDFSQFLQKNGLSDQNVALKELYNHFYRFASTKLDNPDMTCFNELMKFDYFSSDNSCNPPSALQRISEPGLRRLYTDLKHSVQEKNRIHLEVFSINPMEAPQARRSGNKTICCFDYGKKHPVTGLYTVTEIHQDTV